MGNDNPMNEFVEVIYGEGDAKENSIRAAKCFKACRGIPLTALESGVIGEMVEALKQCLSDLKWIESQDEKNNFQGSILFTKHILAKLERRE